MPLEAATVARRSVLLATDGSVRIDVGSLAAGLNRICTHLNFEAHAAPFPLGRRPLSNPATYRAISRTTRPLTRKHSLVVIATKLPYDNNFFFDFDGDVALLSFSDWKKLTNLPASNGLVGLLATLLADDLVKDFDDDLQHDVNTGCVYDFLLDKRGIDLQLRAGVMCRACTAVVKKRARKAPTQQLPSFDCTIAEGLEDVTAILDEVSRASKREEDLAQLWKAHVGAAVATGPASAPSRGPRTPRFHVFLCHNKRDRVPVRALYRGLRQRGLNPWLDEECLQPGEPWIPALEKALSAIEASAVIVGPHGQGPWQMREVHAILVEMVRRGRRVIPVLLWGAPKVPKLPLFLGTFMWVDFRKRSSAPWDQLVRGIVRKPR